MQIELKNIVKDKKGQIISCEFVNNETGEILTPMFNKYTMKEHYEEAGVKAVEPMTAKEYLNDDELEKMLNSDEYYAEEKLDGTRATLHLGSLNSRVFSRRISKHTDWYVENTDSLPQLREIGIDSLAGTIIDGEMRIDGREFKEVSSTLNCSWDKAIIRQLELGFITLHAFDIIYYKGIYIAKMPLWKRKQYLEIVVKRLHSEGYTNVRLETYTTDNVVKMLTSQMIKDYEEGKLSAYPNLAETIRINVNDYKMGDIVELELDKRTWYEYILYNGGEGLMLKHKDGLYKHTRGREFTKWKKFITRDCVIMGFSEPTKEYKGKAPATWDYWEDYEGDIYTTKPPHWNEDEYAPISKFYAMNWVGNMRFGVVVTSAEIVAWQKANKTTPKVETINGELVLEVGECAGYDEAQRVDFTDNRESYVGHTVEILANEIFTKTGKLRHPRMLRLRSDKEMERCTWKDHVSE